MRHYLKSYWFWFYLAAALISVLDYIDHATRPDDPYFRVVWFRWLLMTIFSAIALCLCIHYLNIPLRKFFKTENILLQSVTIVLALLVHQYITGPAFDFLLFGHSTLNFKFNVVTVIIALFIFYIIRTIVFLLTRKGSASQANH